MSELLENLRTSAEALAVPIPGDAPGGADISFEPDFDSVRAEVDKLTSMSGETPNWAEVVSTGELLLKEKTKDMRLLTWVAMARMKRDGLEGLATGLAGISAVCRTHWDGMFPPLKRAKARGNLAGWLGEMILTEFSEYVPTAKDKAALEVVEALFNDVDEVLSEKLADKYDGMGPIRSWVRDKTRMIPADVPPPAATAAPTSATPPPQQAAAAPPAAPAAVATPVAAAAPVISGAGDVLPALRTLGKGIVEASRHLRQSEPASAWPYRLGRLGIWLAVKQAPPAEGGKTKIPPPPPNDANRLKALFDGQQWSELVGSAEGLASQYIFWLDLHRLAAVGLERLGPAYSDAREAVAAEVLAFVRTNPMIIGLAFADGTPFADEATKTWIEEEQAKVGQGGGGGDASNAQVDEEEAELRERFQAAREMVLGGKISEGLSLAIQLSRRSSDARSRFRARLETAQLALRASKPEIARPLLDGLVFEAEEHRLEHWEPKLCADVYLALIKARKGNPEGGKIDEAGELRAPSNAALFDRLCRLDPAAAMKAAGN